MLAAPATDRQLMTDCIAWDTVFQRRHLHLFMQWWLAGGLRGNVGNTRRKWVIFFWLIT